MAGYTPILLPLLVTGPRISSQVLDRQANRSFAQHPSLNTGKRAISARDGLPVAAAASKQVILPESSAGADGGITAGSDGWECR